MRIEWRSGAEDELVEAFDWYELAQPGLGDEFHRDIDGRCGLLLEHPYIGRGIDEKHRQYRLRKFRYALIYRVENDAVVISAVAHGSRRPGYWRNDPRGVREAPASYRVAPCSGLDRAA